MQAAPQNKTLGIIAGKGSLPGRIIDNCRRQGRDVFVLAFEDATDPSILEDVPYEYVRLGAVGHALELFRSAGVGQVVMAGRIERPSIADLRPDWKGTQLLARIGTSLFAGDDKVLRTVVEFFEEEGFEILGVEQVLDDVLASEGPLGNVYPDKQTQADIARGVEVAKAIGALDVGQAVMVQRGCILGVEAVEGTDNLIKRCAELKIAERGGVLVKVSKPGQERRVDLPTIGIHTIMALAEAGFAGVAVEAGNSLVLDRRELIMQANQLGLFVVGFTQQ